MTPDKDFLTLLGKRIEQLATEKYKTQLEFAATCDVDERTLRRIFKAEQNASILVLRKIANGLEISLKELVDI